MRKDQAGSNAVLAGSVFDPLDVPFLPRWPELETRPTTSTTLHADQPKRGDGACVTDLGSDPTQSRACT